MLPQRGNGDNGNGKLANWGIVIYQRANWHAIVQRNDDKECDKQAN